MQVDEAENTIGAAGVHKSTVVFQRSSSPSTSGDLYQDDMEDALSDDEDFGCIDRKNTVRPSYCGCW